MRKVVFLDRDGVINRERGTYTYREADFEINAGVFEALQKFSRQGYEFIVVTNQGGIAKGMYTQNDVNTLHNSMLIQFEKNNVALLEIYYCPHHNEVSRCLCRKPLPLLIEKAIARFRIDASKSFMIGDNSRDVAAAEGAGVKGIKVDSNSNLNDINLP